MRRGIAADSSKEQIENFPFFFGIHFSIGQCCYQPGIYGLCWPLIGSSSIGV
ncbi:hypothetical protein CNE_BB1p07780 (plasmid) [Cupriavidus necator N-1]|uniref:Uncharacterized protein n=1 Tax=Cupriavidus necator (strain ATCC 43291 / DSM 13513 / CCUG 52238 / LMG 8453 / N-1) TaxID=1042878 RepID=F8GXX5_CUPNN|nr:hypothetical protein CNE_BB1p07780 [Cupriavidus necator N-1]